MAFEQLGIDVVKESIRVVDHKRSRGYFAQIFLFRYVVLVKDLILTTGKGGYREDQILFVWKVFSLEVNARLQFLLISEGLVPLGQGSYSGRS